jgi:hypothetical protein
MKRWKIGGEQNVDALEVVGTLGGARWGGWAGSNSRLHVTQLGEDARATTTDPSLVVSDVSPCSSCLSVSLHCSSIASHTYSDDPRTARYELSVDIVFPLAHLLH